MSRILLAGTFAVLALLFNSCNPQSSSLGSELLGGADVFIVDTFALSLKPVLDDSTRTDQGILNGNFVYNLTGDLDDPQFGNLRGTIYTRFQTQGNDVEFPADAVIESVDLTLYVLNSYGDRNSEMRFSVHELSEVLPSNTPRYATDSATYQPENLLATDFKWKIPADTAFTELEVTMPLKPAFGEKLLKAPSTVYDTPDQFMSFFRGLRIDAFRANATDPGVMYVVDINRVGTNFSRIRMRYRTAAFPDSVLQYDFVVPNGLPHFHSLVRSETANTLLERTLTSADESAISVPAQCGLTVKVAGNLMDISSLKNQPINRAQLILSVDKQYIGENPAYEPPQVLSIFEALSKDPNNENPLLRVASTQLNKDNYTYTFDITTYVRDRALDNTNSGFIIVGNRYAQFPSMTVPGARDFLQRVVLGGSQHPTLKPRLKVYITRVESD